MARRDLTNEEVYQMGQDNPGSAAEYLRLRREEQAAEKQAAREKEDLTRFTETFVSAGGTKSAAKEAYDRCRNENAERAAREADEAAILYERRRIGSVL
jgi:hypothetical protein